MAIDNIRKIVNIYILSIVYFFIFRLALFFIHQDKIQELNHKSDIFWSFFMGLRFDLVITGYLLALPYIVLTLFNFFKIKSKFAHKLVFYFTFLLFTIAFLISAADIPYFGHFLNRFSIDAFMWMDSPKFVIGMVLQEPSYFLVFIPFIFILYLFYKVLKKIILPIEINQSKGGYIILSVFLSFFFCGINVFRNKRADL